VPSVHCAQEQIYHVTIYKYKGDVIGTDVVFCLGNAMRDREMVGKMVGVGGGGDSTVESEVAEIFHGNCMIPGAPWERGG
jgi:hypothetical protein